MVKLSSTSKLNARSWSLQAFETCPGSVDKNGVVPSCVSCYARQGFYVYAPAKNLRKYNKEDWKRPEWVQEMVTSLDADKYFRWFDSGDIYHVKLAKKILEVMKLTPWVKHWLPTKALKFAKYANIIKEMDQLPNVKVRFSSDSIDGEFTQGVHGSTIIHNHDSAHQGVKVCEAYNHDGNCNGCRACWDKSIDTIAYPMHGKIGRKIIRLKLAA